jgi:hypothetical protein
VKGDPGHQRPSWWQTGQSRRAARRSQRRWVRAVVSWNPQVGQDASRCRPTGAGPAQDGSGSGRVGSASGNLLKGSWCARPGRVRSAPASTAAQGSRRRRRR